MLGFLCSHVIMPSIVAYYEVETTQVIFVFLWLLKNTGGDANTLQGSFVCPLSFFFLLPFLFFPLPSFTFILHTLSYLILKSIVDPQFYKESVGLKMCNARKKKREAADIQKQSCPSQLDQVVFLLDVIVEYHAETWWIWDHDKMRWSKATSM